MATHTSQHISTPSRHAVVIPIYQQALSPEELYSIKNAATILDKHDLFFVGPDYLADFLKELSRQFARTIDCKTFADRYFVGIAGYNNLLLSSLFYKEFEDYQYILIAQTDSLLFKDELDLWAGKSYSYIGAPWFEGYTQPIHPLKLDCVGNGGFSLRKVSDFLRVLNQPRIFKNPLMQGWPGNWMSTTYRYLKDYHSFVYKDVHLNIDVNEDLFWSLFVAPRCPFFKIPEAAEAVAFAFEAHPEFLFQLNQQKLPFGCHAWQRYNPQFWRSILGETLGGEYPIKIQEKNTNKIL